MYAQGAVRLLANTLDSLELLIHPFERVLERPNITREPSVGELEETRTVRIERLRRKRLDRCCEPVVHDGSLSGKLGFRSRQGSLECNDLIGSPPTFGQRGTHGEIGAECAESETGDERENDHRVDKR